jgi:hypothetical protein
MISMPKPFLLPKSAYRRVERLALETLEECRTKLGLAKIPLPIPIDAWIERPLNITFGVTDLSHLGDRTFGAAFIQDREIQISDRIANMEGLFRFTCAHELGHLILHKEAANEFKDSEVNNFTHTNKYEREADRFAAAFLMPVHLLVTELFRIAQEQRLDAKRCIAELMMGTTEAEWLWRRKFLPYLTRRFGASLSAVLNRFADLRLPDRKSFLLPKHRMALLRPAQRTMDGISLVDGFPVRHSVATVTQ